MTIDPALAGLALFLFFWIGIWVGTELVNLKEQMLK